MIFKKHQGFCDLFLYYISLQLRKHYARQNRKYYLMQLLQFVVGFLKSKIKSWIQFRIICKMIYSGRNYIIPNAHDAGNGFYYAGSAKAMSCHRFGRTDIKIISMFTKYTQQLLLLRQHPQAV